MKMRDIATRITEGTRNWELGTGNWELGTGNKEQGTRNKEQHGGADTGETGGTAGLCATL
jgi:hypothetical protein